MISKIKRKMFFLIAFTIILIVNCFISYSNSETDAVIDTYKSVGMELKELMYKNLKQIIDKEWDIYINNDFEREKRIDILENSKYENDKLVSRNYNYYIGKISTPSTITAFIYCLDRECNMNSYEYYELTEEETKNVLQNNTLKLITNIINDDENVKGYIIYFLKNVNQMKKSINKTIDGDNVYINIEFDNEEDKKLLGMSVLNRGDLYYYIYNPYSHNDIIDYILKEDILK